MSYHRKRNIQSQAMGSLWTDFQKSIKTVLSPKKVATAKGLGDMGAGAASAGSGLSTPTSTVNMNSPTESPPWWQRALNVITANPPPGAAPVYMPAPQGISTTTIMLGAGAAVVIVALLARR